MVYLASILVVSVLVPPLVWSGTWNDPTSNQYHIQTDEGPERFFRYQTQNGQYRKEKRLQDGTVIGSYAWIDDNGYLIQRDYIADSQGYRILENKNIYVGRNINVGDAVKATKNTPNVPLRLNKVRPFQRTNYYATTPRPVYPPSGITPAISFNSIPSSTPASEVSISTPSSLYLPSADLAPHVINIPSSTPKPENPLYLPPASSTPNYLPPVTTAKPPSIYIPVKTPVIYLPPSKPPSSYIPPVSSTVSPISSTSYLPPVSSTTYLPPAVSSSTYLPPQVASTPRPFISSTTVRSEIHLPSSTLSPPVPSPSSVYLPSANELPISSPRPFAPSYISSTVPPIYVPSSTPSEISSTPEYIRITPPSRIYIPQQVIQSNTLDDPDDSVNPYIGQNGPTYPIDSRGNSFNPSYDNIGNGYDPQYPYYDGISVTNDGFKYYIPRAYHEEQNIDNNEKVGSFGYIDPFGIRRVIYYNAGAGGFKHRKNNRYVGFDATPYDPRPY